MILTDWLVAYVVIGILVGLSVIFFNIGKGHITDPTKTERYILLGLIFFMVAWPLFFFFVVHLMRKKGKEENEKQNNQD